MQFIKKIKQPVINIIAVVIIIVLFFTLYYAIQFFNQPIKKEIHISDTGILIYNTNPITYEVVDVELKGKKFNYLYNNHEDGVYGNVWIDRIIDGKKDRTYLFGYQNGEDRDLGFSDGFYVEFHEKFKDFGCCNFIDNNTPGNMFLTSKDLQTIICGVNVTEDMTDNSIKNRGTQALLVMYTDNIDTANEIINEVTSSFQPFANELSENGWNQ